jgi:Secretion system C-terminal sorting domain
MLNFLRKYLILFLLITSSFTTKAQLFQEDFGTSFTAISTINWPTACRSTTASSYNTSSAPCATLTDRGYYLNAFGSYITTSAIVIPAAGYELTFDFSFNYSFSFPAIEIYTGASCGTVLLNTVTLSNTAGVCTPQVINLDAYAGQTIYIRFRSNTSSANFFIDNIIVDLGSGGGSGCLLEDDFGTSFTTISATNWPSACRYGSPSNYNTSSAPCGSSSDYAYSMNGYDYITSKALSIPSAGYTLDFDYEFSYPHSFPDIEIRSGASCGTTLLNTITLSNTSGVCTPQSINLDAYAGQTIYIRFSANTNSAIFYLDEVSVCAGGGSGVGADYKFADNFNDNDLNPNYAGNDGDEINQAFGINEAERIVFCVISEQEINFAYSRINFYAPSMGWQSSVMSIDNNYIGPGWKYYAVEYISCDLAGGSIAEPTDDFQYYYNFEYGNEFIPVFYHLNTSGIESGGGVTSLAEVFNAPDVISSDNCGIGLPIELLYFRATAISDKVIVNWRTLSEVNNDYFIIERSSDGVHFNEIGKVDGAGNANTAIDYQFDDIHFLNGTSYYRLKQVDYDGSFSYSDLATVNIDNSSALSIYPNPSNNRIYIKASPTELESLKIYSILGQDVGNRIQVLEMHEGLLVLDIQSLTKGIYIVKTNVSVHKLLVE